MFPKLERYLHIESFIVVVANVLLAGWLWFRMNTIPTNWDWMFTTQVFGRPAANLWVLAIFADLAICQLILATRPGRWFTEKSVWAVFNLALLVGWTYYVLTGANNPNKLISAFFLMAAVNILWLCLQVADYQPIVAFTVGLRGTSIFTAGWIIFHLLHAPTPLDLVFSLPGLLGGGYPLADDISFSVLAGYILWHIIAAENNPRYNNIVPEFVLANLITIVILIAFELGDWHTTSMVAVMAMSIVNIATSVFVPIKPKKIE